MIMCSVCKREFKRRDSLTRHARMHSCNVFYTCTFCFKMFTRKDNLKKHVRRKHNTFKQDEIGPDKMNPNITGEPSDITKKKQLSKNKNVCVELLFNVENEVAISSMKNNIIPCQSHVESEMFGKWECNQIVQTEGYETDVKKQYCGLIDRKRNRIYSYLFCSNFIVFFQTVENAFKILVNDLMISSQDDTIFISMKLASLYTNYKENNGNISKVIIFNIPNKELTKTTELDKLYKDIVEIFISETKTFESISNGWSLEDVIYMKIITSKLNEVNETVINCNMASQQCGKNSGGKWIEFNSIVKLGLKCKLCNVYQSNNHMKTKEHRIAKHYFYNDKIQIFGIKCNGNMFSCRIISQHIQAIEDYFHSIEETMVELFERIIQFQDNKLVKVSLQLVMIFKNVVLRECDHKDSSSIERFIVDNKIVSAETERHTWVHLIIDEFIQQNNEYVKNAFTLTNHSFPCIMFLDIIFCEV